MGKLIQIFILLTVTHWGFLHDSADSDQCKFTFARALGYVEIQGPQCQNKSLRCLNCKSQGVLYKSPSVGSMGKVCGSCIILWHVVQNHCLNFSIFFIKMLDLINSLNQIKDFFLSPFFFLSCSFLSWFQFHGSRALGLGPSGPVLNSAMIQINVVNVDFQNPVQYESVCVRVTIPYKFHKLILCAVKFGTFN